MATGTRRSKPSDPTGPIAARLAAVALALGDQLHVDLASMGLRLGRLAAGATRSDADHPDMAVPAGAGPGHLAAAFESSLDTSARRRGAHHTPPEVAAGLTALALGAGPLPATACDPAVGGGAFVVAVAEQLVASGLTPVEAVSRLWGIDVDPLAVAVTETVLALWAGADPRLADRLVVGDFLLEGTGAWAHPPPDGFGLVIGNPPFQSQLTTRSARSRRSAAQLESRFGAVAKGYADTAGVFLAAAADAVAPTGTVCLILPTSLLSARDAAAARTQVMSRGRLRALWRPPAPVFDAAVDVVGLVIDGPDRADEAPAPGRVAVHRRVDGGDAPVGVALPTTDNWSPLLAADEDVPVVALTTSSGVLGDSARTTAGFRQHFYAVAEAARERDPAGRAGLRLVTAGSIDPSFDRWGVRRCRIGGRSWIAPEIDLEDVRDAGVRRWVDARSVPKVLVASQTKVIEAMVDSRGDAVPVTPVISVEPRGTPPPDSLWRLLAVLSAPPVSAWAHQAVAGSGLSRGTIRLSARMLAAVPLPVDETAWLEGAGHARAAQEQPGDPDGRMAALWAMGTAMTAAYGQPAAVTEWWWERLPRR